MSSRIRYILAVEQLLNQHSQLDRLLQAWRRQPTILQNIVEWRAEPERPARSVEIPPGLNPGVAAALKGIGIHQLYCHQAQAFQSASQGRNFVVVTGTASGKTLCYNLAVMDQLVRDPQARALYLFPTKALTQDQLQSFDHLASFIYPKPAGAIYDGDTSSSLRPKIRGTAHVVLTNPDMTHLSILPHHTLWADFFRHLRAVVIDEIHFYRGIFGSHLANLVRRIKRVAAFYGAHPQFYMTSATIGNPQQLAEKLVEEPVVVIDEDGSPRGARHTLLYNPPVVVPDLGIRRGASSESIQLAGDLIAYQIQTILFARARRSVELMLRNLREKYGESKEDIHGYRSGYLAQERRNIEQNLRSGRARVVVATNALELGIDIGGLDAAILVGYPGTIAATRQQAGRAGRRTETALAVLVASASPLDQFLMKHPEYLFEKSPEQALIDPDNLLILLAHLRCAAFELPFRKGQSYGNAPQPLVDGMLTVLEDAGVVHQSGDKYFWTADQYPANTVSLRTIAEVPVLLQSVQENGRLVTIGEVDDHSARWMVHPGAIYLHAGGEYEVESLDLERHLAVLHPVSVDYYTEAVKRMAIEKIAILRKNEIIGAEKYYGEILVTTQVTGFRKIRWGTMEILGESPLDMPATTLRTMAFWLGLAESAIEVLRGNGYWNNDANDYGPNWNRQRKLARERDRFTCQVCGLVEQGQAHHVHHKRPFRTYPSFVEANHLENLVTLCPGCHQRAELTVHMRSGLAGLGYVMQHLAPLFLMCDIEDIGLNTDIKSELAEGTPAVALFDMVPAGIGLSEKLYQIQDQLISNALELVSGCTCLDGCPSCVGPAGENGIGGKEETLAILRHLAGLPIKSIPPLK